MADIAASVLARLKSKAAESGRSYQLCLQLFCQEEFLRRLEKSKYAENLVLKGGLFLYSLTNFDSRVTVDVDFLLRQVPSTAEQLKSLLEEIITVPTGNDFVTLEIKDVAPIAITKKYAGIGASIVARIKNTRTPFSIDFGVGDVIVPKQEKRQIPTQLPDFESPTVNTYSIETTVAEKLDAILSLMEFSSRMKDYYDLYYIANKFDFDGAVLTDALRKTFAKEDMGVWVAVPLVMDGKVGNHALGNEKLPAVVPDKVGLLRRGNIPRYGKHQSPGKLGVPLFLDGFGGVPQGIAVCVLRRGVGRQHDFGVDDFAFMGIVFLFLVVFGKQPFPALVGGGSNGRLALAALDDF